MDMPAGVQIIPGTNIAEQQFYSAADSATDSTPLSRFDVEFMTIQPMAQFAITSLLDSWEVQAWLSLNNLRLLYAIRQEGGPEPQVRVPDQISVGPITITPPSAGQTVVQAYHQYVSIFTVDASQFPTVQGTQPNPTGHLMFLPLGGAIGLAVIILAAIAGVIALIQFGQGKLNFDQFVHGINEANPIPKPGDFTVPLLIVTIPAGLIGIAALMSAKQGQLRSVPALPPSPGIPPVQIGPGGVRVGGGR